MGSRRDLFLEHVVDGRSPDWVVELPYLPPRQPNDRYAGSNPHAVAARNRQIQEQCNNDVYVSLNRQGWNRNAPRITRAELFITFVLPNHNQRDHDNLIAGMKPVLDALHPYRHPKDHSKSRPDGLLVDDHLGIVGIPWYDHEVRTGVEEIVIEVWDCTPERLV